MKTMVTKSLSKSRALMVMANGDERQTLRNALVEEGYEIQESPTGCQLPEMVKSFRPHIMLLDCDLCHGECLNHCRQLRQHDNHQALYIILMTSRSDAQDRIAAFESGVDEFLTKPFDHAELLARLRAAQRILNLNAELTTALNELRQDMRIAATVQRDLLPRGAMGRPPLLFAWDFIPADSVAGDLFNVFPLDEHHVGLYMYDVAGHGMASAMLSASLHHTLALPPITTSITKDDIPEPPFYRISEPADTVTRLNSRYPVSRTGLYFTLFYAVIHLRTLEMRFCRAGHPPPILIREGMTNLLSQGDIPVGLLPDATYSTHHMTLRQGDRLYLLSDGLTESMNAHHETYKTDRAASQLLNTRDESLHDSIQSLIHHVKNWQEQEHFDDDLSVLALEVMDHV